MNLIDIVRKPIRAAVDQLAKLLDAATRGRIHPNTVTIVGALMHVPIAYLIAVEQFIPAAILLVIFGLFDTLDGSLARLQNRTSQWGALLDSTTDRMKEVALYAGIIYVLVQHQPAWVIVMTLIACGASLCTSYVRAVGDVALLTSSKKFPEALVNKAFRGGILSFEVRVTLMIVGLVTNQLALVVALIAIGATWTAFSRLGKIARALNS